MAPRQRRIVTQASAEELSPSPSETSSKSSNTTGEDDTTDDYNNHNHNINNNHIEYRTKEDIAKEDHDLFNLFALVLVVTASVINWDVTNIHKGPDVAWKGEYFHVSLAITTLYFFVDLLWVARVPISVKSPDVIIKHHFVAIAYLCGPLLWPEYRWFMGACLSVEINTWFLILRRVLFKRKASPMWQTVVAGGFYGSWIAIRVILYPLIMYMFCCMARERIAETGIWFHWPMVFMPVHFFLCVLNLKWTYDLFMPLIKQCWEDSNHQPPPISSGL